MVMTIDSDEKVYIHELKDLYNAEQQLVKALPKVIKALNREEAKTAVKQHLEETKNQAKRLEQIFKDLEGSPNGVKCKGMEGLIEEADEAISHKEFPKDKLTEALLSGGQKIEHYEIVAYTGAIKSAREMGRSSHADLLAQSLAEEEAALSKLEQLSH
jgi:ferritin-like metal-binding protein YciE